MITGDAPYASDDRLRSLIADNSLLLMVISRFGLPLGLANKPVDEVCAAAGVDTDTFLCVANMISGRPYDAAHVHLASLTRYLKRAHNYFLEFFLPSIRRKFLFAVDLTRSSEVVQTILHFFDEYVAEVRRHMDYENDILFGYIDRLLDGRPIDSDYSIDVFASHHDAISDKLNRLKDVLIRYCPEGDPDMLNAVLFDIINCEADLISHCQVEDCILVPAVRAAEARAERVAAAHTAERETPAADGNALGKREKEIITCIARGMSNKEIADRLCISVHTVTTHRRNICAKLEIHSPAGLTIYAILNGLIDPKKIDL